MEGKMRKTFVFTMCMIILLCTFPMHMTKEANAQVTVTEEWVARYDGLSGYDLTCDIEIGSSGNIYLTGASRGNGTSDDWATIALDEDGNQLWVTRYDGPGSRGDEARALVIDSSENIYVTGTSDGRFTSSDYATIKYDSYGNELWVARYNGPTGGYDYPIAMAIDSSDNVYVTGLSYDFDTGDDYCTVAYDSLGNELWIARYDGTGGSHDHVRAATTDSIGNIYVTGESRGNGTWEDCTTVAYDSNGNELWVARYDGPVSGYDYGTDIAVDSDGYIYVTGYSEGVANYDTITLKYDSMGNELWVAKYNSPGDFSDKAFAMALDPSGNVYITGQSVGINITDCDYISVAYDSDGNELWVARYDAPSNYIDYAYDIAIDSSGNICVAGGSYTNGTQMDYATIAYDRNGNELWAIKYNGPSDRYDVAYFIATDPFGNVYVTGWSWGEGGNGYDYATIKYSQSSVSMASIDIDPDTLNLKSKGRWITAYITLPDDYDVNDIDISTILLEDTIPAEWGDVQGDVLMVKFDRSEVEDLVGGPADKITLTVSGQLPDGTEFQGLDTIRVISPPK